MTPASRRTAQWRIDNPERTEEHRLRYQENRKARGRKAEVLKRCYGISMSQYNQMLSDQNGRCLICNTVPTGMWHVDHDHSCCPGQVTCGQCVRGLLCSQCNLGLGCFKDSPSVLTAAAAYLTRLG